jgi:glycerate kinase
MSPEGRPLTVLLAPDSFKGSLSAVEVAQALARGWRAARPADRIALAPLADGGEGTIDAIAAAGDWTARTTTVTGPRLRRTPARWLVSEDGTRACIEMAEASGLTLVPVADRDTRLATSFGTGELLRAALDAGVRHVTLGIGGSATTDGGAGLLEALGARLLRADGSAVGGADRPATGGDLRDVASVDLSGLDPRLASVHLEVASDVSNPLLGPSGAAAIFGPQKGATLDVVAVLDGSLATWADALERATGRQERETRGAGAAGGIGFALLAVQDRFGSFALRPGVELVMEATGFEARLAEADIVLTGEGRIDESTAFGKTALGVARRAAAAGVPCVAVGGGVTAVGANALRAVGAVAVPATLEPMPVEAAIRAGAAPVEAAGERIARLVGAGIAIAEGSAVGVG